MNNRKLMCFLVEDEEIEKISTIIKNHPRLELIGTSIILKDVAKIIKENDIDILFLDNELGKGTDTLRNSGLDFLDILKNFSETKIPHVISVSQYPETDTQKALDLGVWDVIPKPFGQDTFNQRIQRAIEDIDLKEKLAIYEKLVSEKKSKLIPEGKIRIKEYGPNQKEHLVDLSNIVYLKADAQIIEVHLNEPVNTIIRTWSANFETLSGFYNKILTVNQKQFFSKIHRSYIVNICYIEDVEANNRMELRGISESIPIGNSLLKKETMDKWKTIFQANT